MTKTERLMSLINMIKKREVVSVQDMSREFDISQRTVYRDLNTLSRMNIPVYYENGYRLGQDNLFSNGLGSDEKELIRYCLHRNPLASDRFFLDKFKEIEQKILKSNNGSRDSMESIFLWEKSEDISVNFHRDRVLNDFLKAVFNHCLVYIAFKKPGLSSDRFIPVAVKMSRGGSFLVVSDNSGRNLREVAFEDIKALEVTDEKFDRRPVELIQGR
ncbi:MAG: helix-turn-helix transcriptional regulator [Candidatus Zixiibacteriota bacterium]